MYQVSREFSAAIHHVHEENAVDGVLPDVSGHSIKIRLYYQSLLLNPHAMILEDESMSAQAQWIADNIDRQNINEIMQKNGTPQALAKYIYDGLKVIHSELFKVSVYFENGRNGVFVEDPVP